jgi:hypothetical protein
VNVSARRHPRQTEGASVRFSAMRLSAAVTPADDTVQTYRHRERPGLPRQVFAGTPSNTRLEPNLSNQTASGGSSDPTHVNGAARSSRA